MHAFIVSHLPFIAVMLTGFFLWCYLVLASVEFGATLFLLFPRLAGEISISKILNPIWEANNVFLVGFIVSLIAFFPGFIPWLATVLFVPLCFFLVVSGLRILLVLVFFYSRWVVLKKNLIIRLLFTGCAFAGPALLAFMAAIVIMGISPSLWPASFVWFLTSAVFFSVSSLAAFAGVGIGLFCINELLPSYALKIFTDVACIAYAAGAVWLFKILPVFSFHALAVGIGFSTAIFWFSMVLLLALAVIVLGRLFRRPLVAFTGLAAVAGILVTFIAILQRPYLVYPFITATGAFTAPATAKILFIVFAAGLVVLIPSLILLYRLFIFNPK